MSDFSKFASLKSESASKISLSILAVGKLLCADKANERKFRKSHDKKKS